MSLRPYRLLATFLLALFAFTAAQGHDAQAPSPLALQAPASAVVVTGVVDALAIDDRVNNTTETLYALRLDNGQMLVLTGASELSGGARVEVTGNLSGETLEATGLHVVGQVADQAATPGVAREIQGTLALYHKDYFAENRGEYGFSVYSSGALMTPLNFAVIPGTLHPGMTVSVSGTTAADGVTLDATRITILALAPAQVTPATATTNNVLVIPIRFSDSPADPFTPAAIDQVMRTNAASTTAYYNDVSYGQHTLNVTVACTTTTPSGCAANTDANGWLVSSSATPASCDFGTMGSLANAAATAAGYNTGAYFNLASGSYQNIYYVLPSIPACGWAGLAYVGYGLAWSNGYNALWVYGHELGHNFGLYHAGSVNCAPLVLSTGCGVAEYGDRFDVMGNNSAGGQQMHFNAMQKANLGWIPASSVVTHTSGSATYVLSPLESGGQSTYAIRIPVTADANRTYWIEYRQPIGFDSGIASYPNLGAIIHVAEPFDNPCTGGCVFDDTEILDMTPATAGNFYDAALLVGQNYTDSTYGVSVSVTAATASALTVHVSVAGGNPTATALTSSANPSTLGGNVTFTATVTGTSLTGTVAFVAGDTIPGCAAVALTTTVGHHGHPGGTTATCTTASLGAGVHSIVATYSGDTHNAGSSSAPLTQTVNKAASSTAIATSQSVAPPGASVTFTATVTGVAPTGSVNFLDGSASIAGCAAIALSGSGNVRTAQCATASLALGIHSISARYGGDGGNAGSTSAPLAQLIGSGGQHHR